MVTRLLTLNVRNCSDAGGNSIKERSLRLRRLIYDAPPDIVCFQECSFSWRRLLYRHFRREYGIYTARRGSIFDEALIIMWKKDKFTCDAKGRFFLSDSPDNPHSECYEKLCKCKRITSYAHLCADDCSFYILNTHFGFYEPERIKSAECLCDVITQKGLSPCIIAGDFNAEGTSKAYSMMAERFTDADTRGEHTPTYHGYGKVQPKRIDYIFVDKSFSVNDFHITDEKEYGWVSDHYALLLDFRY